MVPRLTILSVLIISTTCSILPLIPIQIQLVPNHPLLPTQEVHIPNYSFSYNVNDEHTGDIKHQQETRHGGTVTGQYSLIQPDGVRRTVDYRADDARGFLATVSNNRGNLNRQFDDKQENQSQQWQSEPQTRQQKWQQPQPQQGQPQPQQWQPQQQHWQQPQLQYGQPQPQQWQTQPQNIQDVTPVAPLAISRTSIIQNVQNVQSRRVEGHPWS